jgi:hypothetical protein
MLNLLDSFGKRGTKYNLENQPAQVIDTDYLSKYFVVSEFNPTFTAGKNSLSFNGSNFLMPNTEIFVECLDSAGNTLFIDLAKTSDISGKAYAYKESSAFIVAIHVYNDTSDGVGKLMLYGTLSNGSKVRWMRNVFIDKTLTNTSKVRFYQTPLLEVSSINVPILSSAVTTTLLRPTVFSGKLHSLAIDPPTDTNLASVNKRNIDVDYRLIVDEPQATRNSIDYTVCNSQMIRSPINLKINKIRKPFSSEEIVPTTSTASFIVSNIINNSTMQVSTPYTYLDTKNNSAVTNIISASFTVEYPFVDYNDTTASYQTTTINGITYILQNSYANVVYRNLRSFTGYVARHKIYRKSLLFNADFSLVADEPLFINEMLRDNLTQNKFYELLGKFYNDQHIDRYWFTSSANLTLTHTPDVFIDSMLVASPNYSNLSGSDYIMVKNDSTASNRNAQYVPYIESEFLATLGTSYDSNFINLKANVQYIIQVDATIQKNDSETQAALEFYFTSSVPAARMENEFTENRGIKLARLTSNAKGTSINFDKQLFFFTPENDLYGTMVIFPYKCQSYLKNISFRVYGDDGISPDVFETRIPWAISAANEIYEIKAELFDVNHNLIYSDLRVLQNFDPSGSSLIANFPDFGSGSAVISGSLTVANGIVVQQGNVVLNLGNLIVPNMADRPGVPPLSQSRMIAIRGDVGATTKGEIVASNIVDIYHNDEYLTLATGSIYSLVDPNVVTNNPVFSRHSIVTQYTPTAGRKIYWIGGVKQTENGPYS